MDERIRDMRKDYEYKFHGCDVMRKFKSPTLRTRKLTSFAFVLHDPQLILLCVPQPRNGFGDADVVCLERVQGDAEGDGSDAEGPHGDGAVEVPKMR